MNKMKPAWTFGGGLLLGVALMFCVGAGGNDTVPLKNNWAHLQVVAYPAGTTGFFDPTTGTIYIYDANLQNCYLTRKLMTLGEPLTNP
jgi:hypothetical protein